jgi:hypothetical protein
VVVERSDADAGALRHVGHRRALVAGASEELLGDLEQAPARDEGARLRAASGRCRASGSGHWRAILTGPKTEYNVETRRQAQELRALQRGPSTEVQVERCAPRAREATSAPWQRNRVRRVDSALDAPDRPLAEFEAIVAETRAR